VLWGTPREPLPVAAGAARERVLAALRIRALGASPPTGFDGDVVLQADGRRSERLDIRAAAIAPIVAIARWAGAAAGLLNGSTSERLHAGVRHGVLCDADAQTLAEAFELALGLRLDHQMRQLAGGRPPDDRLAPSALSPLARDYLRDVFRAVASVQRGLAP
jgi:CBS domain-containing protein